MIKKNIIIYTCLSIIASAINYLTYPILCRILPSAEYVNITVSLSIFTQITTFLSSIVAITIGLSKTEKENKNSEINVLQSFVFLFFIVVSLAFLALSPIIMNGINTPILFAIPICAMMIISVPIAIISGYLNGKNLMIQLGLLTFISASFQFLFGLITASIFHNGLITLSFMAIAQICAITVIHFVFKKNKPPKIRDSIRAIESKQELLSHKSIIIYTVFASAAIMFINLAQIADLLIIQASNSSDIKLYTDIYIISRIIFFGGMIFIWPFLGEININNRQNNKKPFYKLIAIFSAMTAIALLVFYFFGDLITNLLFGTSYQLLDIRDIGTLSILYKFSFLIITAVILFLIVIRSYSAVLISSVLSLIIVIFGFFIVNNGGSIISILTPITIIAMLFAVICSVKFLIQKPNN